MYVLQDAATMYLFGNVFVSVVTHGVPETEVSLLLENAWGAKREWPQRLLLPSSIAPDSPFFAVAKRNNIAVEVVPESVLAIYSKDVQTAFRDYFGRDGTVPPNPAIWTSPIVQAVGIRLITRDRLHFYIRPQAWCRATMETARCALIRSSAQQFGRRVSQVRAASV